MKLKAFSRSSVQFSGILLFFNKTLKTSHLLHTTAYKSSKPKSEVHLELNTRTRVLSEYCAHEISSIPVSCLQNSGPVNVLIDTK